MKLSPVILLMAGLMLATTAGAQTPGYVPMKVIQTQPVIFPRAALDLGVTAGEVHVGLQVDEQGKLVDHLVTAYTHPALAESVVTALKKWEYQPAYVDGAPRSATIDLTFVFENRGLVVVDLSVTSAMNVRDVEVRSRAYAFKAATLRQLDRIPTPTKVVQPPIPGSVSNEQRSGVVVVMFYIDPQGRVRLPAVSRETSEAGGPLAAAAVQAVSQWEFEPPLSRGVPVLVAARQEFNFKASAP